MAANPLVGRKPRGWNPSTPFLLLLNGVILLGICTWDGLWGNLLTLILGLFVWGVLVVLSGVLQAGVGWVDSKGWLRPSARTALYLLPSLLFGGWVLFGPRAPQPVNQRSPSSSPSGKFVLTMPIREGRWIPTLADQSGHVLYQDDSDFPAELSVYWTWDREGRVWLYSSDTSKVYSWEQQRGKWVRTEWGYGHTREISRPLTPPEALYHPYAKVSPNQKIGK